MTRGFRLSLIFSAFDQRLIVLRNGVLIGSAHVAIAGPVTKTVAYSLTDALDQLRMFVYLRCG
jgi:hypothetical protein